MIIIVLIFDVHYFHRWAAKVVLFGLIKKHFQKVFSKKNYHSSHQFYAKMNLKYHQIRDFTDFQWFSSPFSAIFGKRSAPRFKPENLIKR
jgi:hypothetical protein